MTTTVCFHPNKRSGTVLALLTTWLALPAPALGAPAATPPRVVMIATASEREASARALQAVRGQLSDVSASLAVHAMDQLDPSARGQLRAARAVARLKGAAVVFWFNVGRARVSIYLHGPRGGRLLERPVKSAGAEGRYEALAVIVRFAVRGRLQGRKVGVRLPPPRPRQVAGPPAAPRPPPPLSTSPGARRRIWLALEAGYDMDGYSHQVHLAQGLRVAALLQIHRRWWIFAGFRMEAPLDTESEDVALRLRRFPLDLGGRFLWHRGRFGIGAQLALSVAVIAPRTLALDLEDDEQLQALPTHASVALVPGAVLSLRLWRRLALVLHLGARIHLNHTDYRVQGDEDAVLAPWRVQPTVSLTIHAPLW